MITPRFTTIMYTMMDIPCDVIMQCKEHNLLLVGKTLGILEWFKTIAKWG